MKLLNALKDARTEITVQGVTLYLKNLSWSELEQVQALSTELEKEHGDDPRGIKTLVAYMLANIVTDEAGDTCADPEDVDQLPVTFCIKLVEAFFTSFGGQGDSLEKK